MTAIKFNRGFRGPVGCRLTRRIRGVLTLAAVLAPVLFFQGCSSASSGHAPGVAGGESLVPGTTNFPLAYVKQPVPTTDIDVRDLITSITGGDLYVRDQANAAGNETNVTLSITQGKGAVRDLDVSADGTKLVFSLRLPLKPGVPNDDPSQPNWHLYEYDALAKTVTQLTNDSITAGHDVGAHFLPDGRIVFASTRQIGTQSILIDEGREVYPAQTQPAGSNTGNTPIFLLHVLNADGSIHQISFNTDHDFAPSVLNDGQIVFSRWETTNGVDQISLYRANPDGTGLELYYGASAQSHATGANLAGTNDNVIQFLNARQRPDGKLLAIVRPFKGTQQGGDAVLIDADHFVEIHQPATPTGATGTAQASATMLGITTDADKPSPGGRFQSVYPLYDGTPRMLVSWSPCLVQQGTGSAATAQVCTPSNRSGTAVVEAPPQYTLWIYDFSANTLTPLLSAQAGVEIIEPVILETRSPAPTPKLDSTPSTFAQQTLVANNVGVLDIASVYDFDGIDTAQPNIAGVRDPATTAYYSRPYRFIRIVHPVEIPNTKLHQFNASAFGTAGMGMREILGYAPIQPDGSVSIQVPANVPFTIDILDANGRRVLAPHVNWLQVMPGETKSCNGCHDTNAANPTSHGRTGLTTSVNPGAPFPTDTNPGLSGASEPTMALALADATGCTSGSTIIINGNSLPCSQLLSTDLIYQPIWTTGATVLTGQTDSAFSYLYSDLNTPAPLPVPANCSPVWIYTCRSTIHYPLHIQPVWSLSRQTLDAQGNVLSDHTCTLCHNPATTSGAAQLPFGQLDLTSSMTSVAVTVDGAPVTSYVTSYKQLLFPRDEQQLNMANMELQDTLVPAAGPPMGPVNPATGLRTPLLVDVPLPVPMTAGSALQSGIFFDEFGGNGSHSGWLTPAELRLIAEWLDDGGQYYNDPFVAPP
jgi:hypothetical protein